jgi:PhzF family phenazine biosynthesis protein
MTDDTRALLVDAFADDPLAGTGVGVVPDAADLGDGRMAALARELSAGLTAFVSPAGDADADRRLRVFGPAGEREPRPDATVAAHAHLSVAGRLDAGEHAVATTAGVRTVEVTAEGAVWTAPRTATVAPVDLDYERAAGALGVDPAALRDVGADLAPAVADAGSPVLVVPVNFFERLAAARPDPDAVEALATAHDAAGVFAFTFDALAADSTLHGRYFAGGDEPPVTGRPSAAAGAYLHASGAFDDPPGELRVERGHFTDRPATVRVSVDPAPCDGPEDAGDGVDETDGGSDDDDDDGDANERATWRVRVGGTAVTALDGRVRLPPDEDDDIIEA